MQRQAVLNRKHIAMRTMSFDLNSSHFRADDLPSQHENNSSLSNGYEAEYDN